MIKDKEETVRAQEEKSAWLERNCYRNLYGLLAALDSCLVRRLVETFLGLVLVVILHRHRNQGLVLSELGGYLKRTWPASLAGGRPSGSRSRTLVSAHP